MVRIIFYCKDCGHEHTDPVRIHPRTGREQKFGLCPGCYERWANWVMRQFDGLTLDVEAMSGGWESEYFWD